tara:strand:- start:1272 stop:1397 length:126 start_codon:yes stop_codon:yes gene_type:complete
MRGTTHPTIIKSFVTIGMKRVSPLFECDQIIVLAGEIISTN